MIKVGYLFPGQGAQYVGMGQDLYEKYKPARHIFDTANSVLEFDLKKICFEGPKEELARTEISQPAILTTSIAALRALEQTTNYKLKPTVAAGLSLGEYSALVAAGVLSFEDAVGLVYKRGKFMQEASERNKGAMASVLGLTKDVVEEVCKDSGAYIASLNCPGQVVISATTKALDKAVHMCKERGAKGIVPLQVSGPFHSNFMDDAAYRLKAELENISISKPRFPAVANVTASYEKEPTQIKDNLVRQVNHSVLWEDSVRKMARDGVDVFLEIGPGKVLKGLLRKIDSNLKVYSAGTIEEINAITL